MKTKLALGAVFALGIATSAFGAESSQLALHDCSKHPCLKVSQAGMDPMHDGMQMGARDTKPASQEYRANGKVVAIQRQVSAGSNVPGSTQRVTGISLAHEPVPVLNWPAMTMEFGVASSDVAKGIAPGDNVAFRLVQRGNKYIVTRLEKTGR